MSEEKTIFVLIANNGLEYSDYWQEPILAGHDSEQLEERWAEMTVAEQIAEYGVSYAEAEVYVVPLVE
jgi:hypothetical protein